VAGKIGVHAFAPGCKQADLQYRRFLVKRDKKRGEKPPQQGKTQFPRVGEQSFMQFTCKRFISISLEQIQEISSLFDMRISLLSYAYPAEQRPWQIV
jgi:hypothetical protein